MNGASGDDYAAFLARKQQVVSMMGFAPKYLPAFPLNS